MEKKHALERLGMTVRSYTSAEKCIRSLQKKVATKFRPDKTGTPATLVL